MRAGEKNKVTSIWHEIVIELRLAARLGEIVGEIVGVCVYNEYTAYSHFQVHNQTKLE